MDFEELVRLSPRPPLYEKGTAGMWDDPHISKYLLEAHLDLDTDMASRKRTTIEGTVNWILDRAGKQNMNILDLGCGPGLYAELLAARGHRVTGVDFSSRSIDYARNRATGKNLDIKYLYGNYLQLGLEKEFHLAIMIYCDFTALTPQERAGLLVNVRRALKPSGSFIFDVLNDKVVEDKIFSRECKMESAGFWSNRPHMVLSESLHYPERKVILDQYIVMEDTGSYRIYRFWHHYFSPEEMKAELGSNGFTEIESYENVLEDDESSDIVTFYRAA
ncbi:class I SAM-dependent methyltransferase [Chloroflexota bacterium]